MHEHRVRFKAKSAIVVRVSIIMSMATMHEQFFGLWVNYWDLISVCLCSADPQGTELFLAALGHFKMKWSQLMRITLP